MAINVNVQNMIIASIILAIVIMVCVFVASYVYENLPETKDVEAQKIIQESKTTTWNLMLMILAIDAIACLLLKIA